MEQCNILSIPFYMFRLPLVIAVGFISSQPQLAFDNWYCCCSIKKNSQLAQENMQHQYLAR